MSALLSLFSEFDRLDVSCADGCIWIRARDERGNRTGAVSLALNAEDRDALRAALAAADIEGAA